MYAAYESNADVVNQHMWKLAVGSSDIVEQIVIVNDADCPVVI